MKNVLLVYQSKHGSTGEIAREIAAGLAEAQCSVDVFGNPDDVTDIEDYNAIVLGSAVYAGRWRKDMVDFCKKHARELKRSKNLWLFSSGPVGKTDTSGVALSKHVKALPYRDHVVFGGKIDLEELNVVEKAVLRAIQAPSGDYREWATIEGWGKTIAQRIVR